MLSSPLPSVLPVPPGRQGLEGCRVSFRATDALAGTVYLLVFLSRRVVAACRRVEAEERGLDAALVVFASTQQEVGGAGV